jgi:methylthioribose-1-phosphate isomerase
MSRRTIEWIADAPGRLTPGRVRMIDQSRLPGELAYIETSDPVVIRDAIRALRVRGAPAIGIAAAMGVAAAAQSRAVEDAGQALRRVREAAALLAASRPTAVNLFRALERMERVAAEAARGDPAGFAERLAEEAMSIRDEDAAMCRAIGRHGAALLEDVRAVLTHCNAGGLATAEYGTALAPVYVLKEKGRDLRVYVSETRPLLQGARLTAWELLQAGVSVTLICDSMAAHVMKQGRVQAVLVGADRIAANGDTANKIGTYAVALAARAHRLPFYVLAPGTSFDRACPSGDSIPIEERPASEVTEGLGRRTAPPGVDVYSPAFDVTPAELITAIVCERGVVRPPFGAGLAALLGDAK